ncbi:DUF4235 domain-containing protein [Streptomyces sp. NPDC004288]|uniref:DUF4235 domain-containing protein n=1 Tax=unclassified Streptomyces TaxID=2593676 RepID=UPI003407E9A7
MNATKIAYRPFGLVLGAASGMAAGLAFKQAWKVMGHEGAAPSPTDEDGTWREILVSAALQGAIFAVVKAAVDRAGAGGVRRLTGTWPG